ncbi:MAG TPA: carbohydrate-binding protein [Polyangia bacterium]
MGSRSAAWWWPVAVVAPFVIMLMASGCQQDEGMTPSIGTGGATGLGGNITGVGISTGGDNGSITTDAGVMDSGPDDVPATITDAAPVETAPDGAPMDTTAVPPTDAGSSDVTAVPNYAGLPWNNMAQVVPGMVQASFYDQGGEGVAYHDSDQNNNGADQARASDPTLPEASFRPTEGVDLRSIRAGIDKYVTGMNLQAGQLYVGWTQTGEWVNYTVNVAQTGHYTISALVATLNDGTRITLTLEDGTSTGPRALPWTHSYTAWQFADNIASMDLTAGQHVLQMRFETAAINVEYLSFTAN